MWPLASKDGQTDTWYILTLVSRHQVGNNYRAEKY